MANTKDQCSDRSGISEFAEAPTPPLLKAMPQPPVQASATTKAAASPAPRALPAQPAKQK